MEYFISSGNYLIFIYIIFGLSVLTYISSKITEYFYTDFNKGFFSFYISSIKQITPEERKIIKDFLIDIGIVKEDRG